MKWVCDDNDKYEESKKVWLASRCAETLHVQGER